MTTPSQKVTSKRIDKKNNGEYYRGIKDGAEMMWDLLHKEETKKRINDFNLKILNYQIKEEVK